MTVTSITHSRRKIITAVLATLAFSRLHKMKKFFKTILMERNLFLRMLKIRTKYLNLSFQ